MSDWTWLKARRWYVVTACLLACAILLVWVFVWEPRRLLVEVTTLDLPGWSQPLRIAVLTDLHVGSPHNGVGKLSRIMDRVQAQNPDLVVLPGDFVVEHMLGGRLVAPEVIADSLKRLHAPLGVFAVLGNHDWWLDGERVRRAFQRAGIPVLEDSTLAVPSHRFWLGGIGDLWEGRHDIARALSFVTDSLPVLLFTHNPDIFVDVPGRVALTIAGHTHGGQVRFPIIGAPVIPSEYGQRFAAGHIIENQRHLFVATGTGTSLLGVRFRVPPRISILDLR